MVVLYGVLVLSHHGHAQSASPSQQSATFPDTTAAHTQKPVHTDTALREDQKKETIDDADTFPSDWYLPAGDSTLVIETFDYPKDLDSYPEDVWEGRSGTFYTKTKKREVYYKIQKEGDNYYLNAETEGEAVNFGRKARVNLRLYKKLRWRWRVYNLPEGADERNGDTNDSAAAVRVIIGNSVFSAKAIKYVWSATLKTGTVIDEGRLKVIVVESSPDKLGRWIWEEVDVYDDYVRLFGGDPRPADALGLLTDSNNTQSFVKADYDDFIFIIPRPDTVEMVPDFMLQNR